MSTAAVHFRRSGAASRWIALTGSAVIAMTLATGTSAQADAPVPDPTGSITAPATTPATTTAVADPAPVPLPWNTATTTTIAGPGQRIRYTVPMAPYPVYVSVSSIALNPAVTGGVQPYELTPTYNDRPVPIEQVGSNEFKITQPYDPEYDQPPMVLTVSARGDATGTLVVSATKDQDQRLPLTLDTAVTVELSARHPKGMFAYTTVIGRRERLQVTSASLVRPDGSAGSAGVLKDETRIGTIGAAPITIDDDQPSDRSTLRYLDLVPEDGSSGTITFSLTLIPDPAPIAITLGRPATITLATAHVTQRLTLPVTVGARYTFRITDAAMTSSTKPDASTAFWLMSPGADYVQSSGLLPQSATASFAFASTGTGELTVLVDPEEDITGHFTISVSPTQDVVTALCRGIPVTRSGSDLQHLVFTSPGAPDGRVPSFRLSDIRSSGLHGPVDAHVDLVQGGRVVRSLGDLDRIPIAQFPAVDPGRLDGFDGHRPWQLVVSVAQRTDVTLTVLMVVDPTITLVPGQARVIPWTAGQDPELAVPAKAGTRLLMEVLHTSGTEWKYLYPSLYTTSHAFSGSLGTVRPGEQPVLESQAPAGADGTRYVRLHPSESAPGTATVRIWLAGDQQVTGVLGEPLPLTVRTPGERVKITLQVPAPTSGGADPQSRRLDWTVAGSVPATITFRDDEGLIVSGEVHPGSSTGTFYRQGLVMVTIDPVGAATGSFTFTLARPATAAAAH